MHIQRLDINAVRNIGEQRLQPLGLVNIFFGANGSGKTSILEAIHLLCLGRSFRSRQIRSVIQDGQAQALVFSQALDPQTGRKFSVGVRRGRSSTPEIRIDGESVSSLAALAELFPIQLLNSDSFELIEGGPAIRRQFIDWGVFHVEHSFISHWQAAKKCIKHRNSLLRHGKIEASSLDAWDKELAQNGEKVDAARRDYLAAFTQEFQTMAARVTGIEGLSLEYARGWPDDISLEDALRENRGRDIEQGFSSLGPHRAELKIRVEGKAAAEVLSRGQEKILVCALRLAQASYLRSVSGKECAFLIDDLPAELDADYRKKLCTELESLKTQVFISCIEPGELKSLWSSDVDLQMFHVEQGEIRQQSEPIEQTEQTE